MNNEFQNWINRLAIIDYFPVRNKIMQRCNVSKDVFKNWKTGRTPVPFVYKKEINRIFKEKIFKFE